MRAPPGTTTDGITILEEGEGQPEVRYIDRKGAGATRPRFAARPAAPSRSRLARPSERGRRPLAAASAGAGRGSSWPCCSSRAPQPAGGATGTRTCARSRIPFPSWWARTKRLSPTCSRKVSWTIERTETRQDGTVPGQILAQDPAAGTQLKEGDPVKITVSLGPTLVPLPPELVGKPIAEAQAELQAAGFLLGEVTTEVRRRSRCRCRARTWSRSTPANAERQCGSAHRLGGPSAPDDPIARWAQRRSSAPENSRRCS